MASTSVSTYITAFPKSIARRLKTMRSIIKKAAPDAEEKISYGLAGYTLYGRPLIYFGGFKNHVGFYATPAGNSAFKKELAGYKTAKGSVQFPHDVPLPEGLIRRMVVFRVKENKKRIR